VELASQADADAVERNREVEEVEEVECQNNGRPEMTDRRRRLEMTDQRQHVRR